MSTEKYIMEYMQEQENEKGAYNIVQPHGGIVADWYRKHEPSPIEILEMLALALAGKVTSDDLKRWT